jgi:polyphosphate kinase
MIQIQLRDNVKARLLTNDLSNDFVQNKSKPLRSQQEIFSYLVGKSVTKQIKNK